METRSIVQAAHSLEFLCHDLRLVHRDAIESGNGFAEMTLFDCLTKATELRNYFRRVKSAAGVDI